MRRTRRRSLQNGSARSAYSVARHARGFRPCRPYLEDRMAVTDCLCAVGASHACQAQRFNQTAAGITNETGEKSATPTRATAVGRESRRKTIRLKRTPANFGLRPRTTSAKTRSPSGSWRRARLHRSDATTACTGSPIGAPPRAAERSSSFLCSIKRVKRVADFFEVFAIEGAKKTLHASSQA